MLLLSESLANETLCNVNGDTGLYTQWVEIVKGHAYLQEVGKKLQV